MNSRERFENIIAQVSVNYRKDLNDAELANFKLMVKKWGIDAFEEAIYKHLFDEDEGMFFPTIAHISKKVNGSTKQKETDVKHRAELAWAEIERKIARVGSYGKLKTEDRQALAAVNCIGGWNALCMKTYEELTWVKKEFLSSYDMLENTPQSSLPNSLKGILCDGSQDEKKSLKSIPSGIDELKSIVNKNEDEG